MKISQTALAILPLIFMVACGGGETADTTSGPTISSISGDGSTPERFTAALIVIGENFTDDMHVDLVSLESDQSFELSYNLDSPSQITAELPSALDDGQYQLILTTDVGSAVAELTILQGEPGPQGPAGEDGIMIEAQFSCGLSGDLDPTNDNRAGISTQIVRFSDGSYYITCDSDFLDGDFLFIDTSSSSGWFASDSTGVVAGSISCVPFYVTAHYSISGNTVTYVNQADSSQTQTVVCTQTYP